MRKWLTLEIVFNTVFYCDRFALPSNLTVSVLVTGGRTIHFLYVLPQAAIHAFIVCTLLVI